MSTYFSIWTAVGKAKLANAIALGKKLQFSTMVLGDGNGVVPAPKEAQTALINQVFSGPINQISVDPANASQVIAEMVVAAQDGGFWVRECGLKDVDGDLCVVANCPPSYKPLQDEGSVKDQVMRLVSIVSNTAAVELKIDPAVVLATRQYADTKMTTHLADVDPHAQYWNDVRGNAKLATKQPLHANLTTLAGTTNPIILKLIELGATTIVSLAELNFLDGVTSAIQAQLNAKAPLANPDLTGTVKVPNLAAGTNNTQAANTAFVTTAIANAVSSLVNGSGAALDTLKELADALGNDPNFATTIATSLGEKVASNRVLQRFSVDGSIGANVDLDTMTTPGIYHQNQTANAVSGSNYPAPLAGRLVVDAGSNGSVGFLYQEYWTFASGNPVPNQRYYRSKYQTNAWSPWKGIAHLDSPPMTGTPTVPTAIPSTNNTQAASTAFANSSGALVGSSVNLVMNIAAASTSATLTADEVVVKTGLGGAPFRVYNVNRTIDLSTVGAGGMDTGTAPVSGYVGIYLMYNPTTELTTLIAQTAATKLPEVYGGANAPAGYTMSALVSVRPTNSLRQFVISTQWGRKISLQDTSALTTSTQQSSVTALSLSACVPANARSVSGSLSVLSSVAPSTSTMYVYTNSAAVGRQGGYGAETTAGTSRVVTFNDLVLIVTQTLYYMLQTSSGTMSANIVITGYTI